MKTAYILSSSRSWAEALGRYLKWVRKMDVILIPIPPLDGKESTDIFFYVSHSLENHSPINLRNSVAILDAGFYHEGLGDLNPLPSAAINPVPLQLAAMLTLAFPEIQWVFYYVKDKTIAKENPRRCWYWYWTEKVCNGVSLHLFPSLFDASGFRIHLRRNMQGHPDTEKFVCYLHLRHDTAAASIDEEEPYAFLHGYLTYRMGYRTYPVTTMRMMRSLFAKKAGIVENIHIQFEDIFLNFPDKDMNVALSRLIQRDKDYEKLAVAEKRIFVTVGHRSKWEEENLQYIRKQRLEGKRVKLIYKPCGGMYNILEKAGRLREYWNWQSEGWNIAKPPKDSQPETGHSAPGKLLLIANKLIDRAKKIFENANTATDCLHGAILSLEAQEILGYRTPTTCLEAIALRHKLEVKAECMFYGMEHNIEVRDRIREIEGDVAAVSEWFHISKKKASALNAKMGIITEITKLFREAGQFDEELVCLKYFRKLNRQWYFINHPWVKILHPLRWYLETLVGSFPLFVIAVLGWPLLFGVISFLSSANFKEVNTVIDHITHTYITFFGLQPSGFPEGSAAHILTIFLILGGFLHLGIFVSSLYTLISRR